MITIRLPARNSSAYRAAEHIYKHGAIAPHDLFSVVQFTERLSNRMASLERALGSGFLCEVNGLVGITEFARDHFRMHSSDQPAKYVGEVVQPRSVDVMNRPALSKKNIPQWRDSRADIPAWSVKGK